MVLIFLSIIPNRVYGISRSEGTTGLAPGQSSWHEWIDTPAGEYTIFFEMETYNSPFNCNCWVRELNAYIWANITSSSGSFRVYLADSMMVVISNTDSYRQGTVHWIFQGPIIDGFPLLLILGLSVMSIIFILLKMRRSVRAPF